MNANKPSGSPPGWPRPAEPTQRAVGGNPLFTDRRPDDEEAGAPEAGPSGSGVTAPAPSQIVTRDERPAIKGRRARRTRPGRRVIVTGLIVAGLVAGAVVTGALLRGTPGRDRAKNVSTLAVAPLTARASVAPPPPPPSALTPAGSCTATVSLDTWPGGFVARVTVHAGQAVHGWTVTLDLPAGVTITQMWNGARTRDRGRLKVSNLAYNGVVNTGKATEFGYKATGRSAGTRLACRPARARPQSAGAPQITAPSAAQLSGSTV